MNIFKERLKLLYRACKYRYLADRQEISFLLKNISPGLVAIDIGAHKGGYTFWMQRAVGDKGKVIAFEPQPAGADLLCKLFDRKNIIVENKALSDEIGQQLFYVQPQNFDVSFEASLQNKYSNATELKVRTDTVDAYCERNMLQPSFIKIDVEGAEAKVINGALKTIMRFQPVILMEIEARHIGAVNLNELCNRIEAMNYDCFFFYRSKQHPFSSFDATIHQDERAMNTEAYANNFAFLPKVRG